MKKSSSIHLIFSLTFAVIVGQPEQVPSVNDSHCDRVLRRDHLNSAHSWNNANQCHLHTYRTQDVVQCFDADGARLHVAFIGDSRTRQQFFSLLKILPDYDFQWENYLSNQWQVHHDMTADSSILNARFSFHWRPLFNDTVIEEVHRWSVEQTPTIIIMGLGVHHMLPEYQQDHETYKERLAELVPFIRKLSTKSRVIWLHQNPVLKTYEGEFTGHFALYITQHLIEHYNEAARRIFRGTGAVIWDSGLQLATEYTRGCAILGRAQENKHHRCADFIHIGYVAIDKTTQILLNFLCNRRLAKS